MTSGYNKQNDILFREMIKAHEPTAIGMKNCRQAAVCIPVIFTDDGPVLLFEKRSSDIAEQPGDICFPGGSIEDGETPEEAALREAKEELLIADENIHMLGEADYYLHMDHLVIYTFIVELTEYKGSFSAEEVDEIFTVPVSWFRENPPEKHIIICDVRPDSDFPYDRVIGGRHYQWSDRDETVYFYQYHDYTIWGLTARILNSFLEIV